MADLYTGVTVQGLYDNSTESPLFAATGTAVPTSSILVGGSDGVNIQPLSVDSSGRLNVNASSAPPTDSKANATINGDGTGTQFVQISTEGTSQVQVQVVTAGGFDGTLTFQSSLDGTTFHSFVLYPVLPDGTPGTSTTSVTGQWQAPVGGMRLFKVSNTPGTTGTATVFITAGQGQYSVVALSPNAANFNATVVVSGTPAVNITQVGGAAITLGQKTMAASFPVVIASDQTAYPVNIQASGTALTATGSSLNTNVTNTVTVTGTVTSNQGTSPWIVAGGGTAGTPATGVVTVQGIAGGTAIPVSQSGAWTVSATQGTSPWVDNLTQVAGVALGATAVTAFGTAPAAANVPGVNASLYAGVTGLTATGTSLNTNVTNTVTVTGTVAVTQSTSPWVVAGNLTNNNAAPAANNVGVLPALIDSGTFPAVTLPAYTAGDQALLTVTQGGSLRVITADEHNASSIAYYSVDTGATLKTVTSAIVFPLVSIRSSSAAIQYLIREVSGFTDGTQELIQLIKNPQTLTGSTFAATAPTGSHVTVDTAATAVTIGTGTVIWSGFAASVPAVKDALLIALAAGAPGDTFTLACQKFGTGTSKAGAQIHWSEIAAAV